MQSKTYFAPTGDAEQNCLQKLNEVARKRNYCQPKVQGSYIVMKKRDTQGFSVGDVRISFEKTVCGPVSLLAQQIQDQDEVFTFREWNPADQKAKFGKEMPVRETFGNFGFRNALQTLTQEPSSKLELFDLSESKLTRGAFLSKCLGLILLFVGLFLLAEPLFLYLQKAPLVTVLQKIIGSSAIYAFVAVFSLTVYSFAYFCVWAGQRPVWALFSLACFIGGVYFTFFHKYHHHAVSIFDTVVVV